MFFEAMIPHIGHFETAPADLIDSVYGEYRPDYFTGETETETIREWVGRIKSMIE